MPMIEYENKARWSHSPMRCIAYGLTNLGTMIAIGLCFYWAYQLFVGEPFRISAFLHNYFASVFPKDATTSHSALGLFLDFAIDLMFVFMIMGVLVPAQSVVSRSIQIGFSAMVEEQQALNAREERK